MSSDPRRGFFSGMGNNTPPESIKTKKEQVKTYFEPQYDPLDDLDEQGRSAVDAAPIKQKQKVMDEQFDRMGIYPKLMRSLKSSFYGSKR